MDGNLLAYLSFTSILVVTPGSTTAVVVRNTLLGGRRAGLACAAGAAVANSTHATLAGLGVMALLARWPAALVAVRVAGAAFLVWIGMQSLWTAIQSSDGGLSFGEVGHGEARGFRDGLAMNLANPAILSFYIAIVPSFVPAAAPRSYFPMLAACHVAMALLCHSTWALALHAVRRWFAAPAARRGLAAATGLALIFLAARVLS